MRKSWLITAGAIAAGSLLINYCSNQKKPDAYILASGCDGRYDTIRIFHGKILEGEDRYFISPPADRKSALERGRQRISESNLNPDSFNLKVLTAHLPEECTSGVW